LALNLQFSKFWPSSPTFNLHERGIFSVFTFQGANLIL